MNTNSNAAITIRAIIKASIKQVWDCYTNPVHIVHWNFAAPSWHCPIAENDLKVGGLYKARMEAKDGSEGFYFEAIYNAVIPYESFTYTFGDRKATVEFIAAGDETTVIISFDPEQENSIELQEAGWQAILNNFKMYTERV